MSGARDPPAEQQVLLIVVEEVQDVCGILWRLATITNLPVGVTIIDRITVSAPSNLE